MRSTLPILVRSAAVFTGSFMALAAVAELRGRTPDLSLWLLDLRDLPPLVRVGSLIAVGTILGVWAIAPSSSRWLASSAAVAAFAGALVALRDTVGFGEAVATGSIRPAIGVPLSAVTAVVFLGIGLLAFAISRHAGRAEGDGEQAQRAEVDVRTPWQRIRTGAGLAAGVALFAIAFPISQMLWFGTTDYRRPAHAAVVFGARVYANGEPSPLLADRLRTAIDLWRAGLVPRLIMSGGEGRDGVNEARAMREWAIRAGVPVNAITVDATGASTDATAAHAVELLGGGAHRLIVVSQAYHLPRAQLAFSRFGIDVLTVPAPETRQIPELPLYVAREVPGFWSYLLRIALG